jgi:hypothetical protein
VVSVADAREQDAGRRQPPQDVQPTALKKASLTSGLHLLNLNSGLILSLLANAPIAAPSEAPDRDRGKQPALR